MSTVPIVQGVAVANPHDKAPTSDYVASGYQQNPMTVPFNAAAAEDYGGNGGQQLGMHAKQPNKFRDSLWAILFLLHFVPLGLYAYSVQGDNEEAEGGGASINIAAHISWISIVALVSVGLSTFSLEGMMRNATGLIKFSLVVTVCLWPLFGIYGLMSGQMLLAVLSFVSFAIGICYAYAVWERIPYAAANLRTALTAVKFNMGLLLVAYVFMALGIAWITLWSAGFGSSLQTESYPTLFCFLLSLYWVQQVLQYTVHVIVAGVVATWWFAPMEAASCFSSALQDSTIRALTYSFGSICFGAFIVAFIRALRVTLEQARRNEDAGILVCLIECILRCIEDFVDYFNEWAYVYVGIYGFSYLDAGREVLNLFHSKGWSVIITDNLVDRVLVVMSLLIGLVGGLVAMFVGKSAMSDEGVEQASLVAFMFGFLLSFLCSTTALGIIGGAVNTVLVLYCEAPAEFERNHPELSGEMRGAWAAAWPDHF